MMKIAVYVCMAFGIISCLHYPVKPDRVLSGEWIDVHNNQYLSFEDSLLFGAKLSLNEPLFKEYKIVQDTFLVKHRSFKDTLWIRYVIDLQTEDSLRLIRIFYQSRDTILLRNALKLKKNRIIPKEIYLKTTGCIGPCPEMEFSLKEDELQIHGIHNTLYDGLYRYKLRPEQLQRIINKIQLMDIQNDTILFGSCISDAWHCEMKIVCNDGSVKRGEGRIESEQSIVITYLTELEKILPMEHVK